MQNNITFLEEHETDELSPGGTLLYGQYTIERHLIDGGFGMTYLARDSLNRHVVVKECFPSSICRRINGEVRPRKPCYLDQYQSVIRNFLREALRLAKFEHPNIVKVHQVFQENNTAYIAMDFVDGMDLLSILDIDPGRLSNTLLQTLLGETLNALDHVHDFGMLHRDISPDNLLLDAQNNLTLIDFGAAREDARNPKRVLSTVLSVKDGYSPHEFYYTDSSHEPSSDLYSVGATFYHLIAGYPPPDCQKRLAALSSGQPDPFKPLTSESRAFDQAFLASIDKALSVSQQKRFQCVSDWLNVLRTCEATPLQQDYIAASPQESAPQVDDLDPSVAEAISSLVEDTNSSLEPVLDPRARQQHAKAPATSEKDDQPNRLVDMFGCPIDDVDAWLREQEKLSKRQRNEARQLNQKAEKEAPSKAEGTGFTLSRVFSALVKRRRRSAEKIRT
ncbi:Serine/threonine-protein kinase StkP [Roseovarius gaetbuli]|uniref:Serine/threonine-protein kinase StkP n=1 Tax=Roseovarius gaetbuli TaxID=1356575 RepID=A0A1X7A955_9RHOB|nr:serine/threonine-protein kinase [Roseovarius gaetbuli]SLN73663.1 Serine/threonine-protein kinase StkP [Roseovarius gaetbuli]